MEMMKYFAPKKNAKMKINFIVSKIKLVSKLLRDVMGTLIVLRVQMNLTANVLKTNLNVILEEVVFQQTKFAMATLTVLIVQMNGIVLSLLMAAQFEQGKKCFACVTIVISADFYPL